MPIFSVSAISYRAWPFSTLMEVCTLYNAVKLTNYDNVTDCLDVMYTLSMSKNEPLHKRIRCHGIRNSSKSQLIRMEFNLMYIICWVVCMLLGISYL